jgi:hypothetical protein
VIARIGSAVHDRSAADDREAAVVSRLQDLAPALDGEPDDDFRTATRARLVAMAAVRSPAPEPVSPVRRLLAGRSTDALPARWRTRLTAGLAGAALTVTALSTLVALSTDARPGDVLYGLKRGTEQTQLALAGDSRRGQTLLDLAGTRLDELEYLVSEGATALPAAGAPPADGRPVVLAAGSGDELVLQTLDTMDAQTTDGAAWLAQRSVTADDAGPLDDLADWVAGQSDGLSALTGEVTGAVHSAFDHSLELLTEIGARADGLRAALDCPAGPATDGSDDLGPMPAPCPPAPAAGDGHGDGAPGSTAGTSGSSGTTPSAGPTAQMPGGTSGGTGSTSTGSTGSGSTGSGSTGSDQNGSQSGSSGDTGGAPGGAVPSGVPSSSLPGGGLPTPSLPLPSSDLPTSTVPSLPKPPLPLPGSSPTTSRPSAGLDVDVCLGSITLGSC